MASAAARCMQAGCSSSNPAPPLRQFCGLRADAPLQHAAAPQPCAARRTHVGGCQLLVTARAAAAGIGLWGTKAGMTQIFTPDGLALPATVIALESGNIVTQVRAALRAAPQVCLVRLLTPDRAASQHGVLNAAKFSSKNKPRLARQC